MATIIYTKSNSTGITGGTNDLVESAVKVLIEHENDKLSAEGGICDKDVYKRQIYYLTIVITTKIHCAKKRRLLIT